MIGKLLFLVALLISLSGLAQEVEKIDLSNEAALKNWTIEGPGSAEIKEGKMILTPTFYPQLKKLMDKGTLSTKNIQAEYKSHLENLFLKKGMDLKPYTTTHIEPLEFKGGHFNIWYKEPIKGDFSISFDFESLSPSALHMIMFCAQGNKGESIFDTSLRKRYGIAEEIMFGDISQYRISFFAPHRKTANMRRAPGRQMVAKGPDLASLSKNKTSRHTITRIHDTVTYQVDGKEVLSYVDKEPLKGGYWGFRVMACGKGVYSNIKINKR